MWQRVNARSRLWLDVNADNLKTGASVADTAPASPTEQVKESRLHLASLSDQPVADALVQRQRHAEAGRDAQEHVRVPVDLVVGLEVPPPEEPLL